MTTYSYFPGCTLKNKARDLDEYGRKAGEILGFTLEEPEVFQCCGGVYPLSKDEIAIRLSSVRTLADAAAKNQTLVTMCSACHNVIKQTNADMQTDENLVQKVNNYLAQDEISYHGETRVLHYLEVLRDEIGYDAVKEKVVKPLAGQKIGAYYGCLLLRPSQIMAMDDAENPSILEDLIAALGAEPVVYAQRNECCSGYLAMEDEKIPEKRVQTILQNAKAQGADTIVTACPLCLYNLKKHAAGTGVEVKYFTEILAQALGVEVCPEQAKTVCQNGSDVQDTVCPNAACIAAGKDDGKEDR